jgi:hypothetical protein
MSHAADLNTGVMLNPNIHIHALVVDGVYVEGRAELEFTDERGDTHYIYVKPEYLRPVE